MKNLSVVLTAWCLVVHSGMARCSVTDSIVDTQSTPHTTDTETADTSNVTQVTRTDNSSGLQDPWTDDTTAAWNETTTSQYDADNGTDDPISSSPQPEEPSPVVGYVPLISDEWYARWKSVTVRYITPLAGVLGLVLNAFGLATLHWYSMNKYFRAFLYAIIVSDEMYLICEILSSVPTFIEAYDKSLASYLDASMFPYLHALTAITFGNCNFLITIMSIERCLKVTFPLKMKNFHSMKYTALIIGSVYFINTATRFHSFIIVEVAEYYDTALNLTMYRPVNTAWAIQNKEALSMTSVIIIVVLRFVPMLITIACNIAICIAFARRNKQNTFLSSETVSARRHREEVRITIIMVVLAIFLTLANFPSSISYLISKFQPETYGRRGTEKNIRNLLTDIGNLLKVINAANDFLVALITSSEIRKIIKIKFALGKRHSSFNRSTSDLVSSETERNAYHLRQE